VSGNRPDIKGEERKAKGEGELGAVPFRLSLFSLRLLPGGFGVLTALLAFWLTQYPGPGLDPDSMSYLGAAVSVSQGHGLRIPTAPWSSGDSTSQLKSFPPGYSLLLALPIRLGLAPQTAARAVQSAAAGATVTIVAGLALSLAGPWASALAAALLLLTPALVEDHLNVLSEPLYLLLLALFLALLLRRPGQPWLHGIVAGLAGAVRYLGGALVGAAMLWALLQGGTWRERLRRAALALLPSALLGVIWVLSVRGTAGSPPATALVADFHLGPALADLREALAEWLAPAPPESRWVTPRALLTGVFAVMFLIGAGRHLDWRGRPRPGRQALWLIVALLIATHFTVLLFARTFVGHEIPFDGRLLSPLMLLLDLLVAVSVAEAWPRWRWPFQSLAALFLLGWLAGGVARMEDLVSDSQTNGWDYNSYDWRRSPTVAWARSAAGQSRVLFSNQPVGLWFHAGRPSADLPESLDADTLAAFAARLAGRPSAIIVFADTTWQPDVPVDTLVAALGLRTVAKFEDGTVYEVVGR
jgi:hypothetical protein